MTKVVNVYLCNPQGGYDIMKADVYKPMAVMMPTAVSVYETSGGEVYVSRMNLGRMSAMFRGTVREALKGGGANLERPLEGVLEGCVCHGNQLTRRKLCQTYLPLCSAIWPS